MATDGPTPPPCDPDILQKGTTVCVVDGRANAVERWVKAVATRANAQVDWHYVGGRANVLHLGDEASHQCVLNAIDALKGELDGHILGVAGPPMALVREVGGQLVLDDPAAEAVIKAVAKHNCKGTLDLNADRINHFKRRLVERGETSAEAVIVFINVDDPYGNHLAELLMPGHNWQECRDRGEVPFARGLARRDGIQAFLSTFDKEAAEKLRGLTEEVAVVVVDHGVAEVFAA